MIRSSATGAIVGIGGLGLAVLGSASGAVAALPVEGCGEVPADGALTRSGDLCQVEFSASGASSWTVPAGLTALHAVVAGGGGGAWVSGSNGYAGSGGDVLYVDLTSQLGSAAAVTVQVGAGGASGAVPAAGETSTLVMGPSTTIAAGGGAGDFFTHYCIVDGNFSIYVGNGAGAGGPAGALGDDCATTTAPGVAPASDADSDAQPALSSFVGFADTLGAGGRVIANLVSTPATLDDQATVDGTGRGADVLYTAVDQSLAANNGGDGRIVLRFPALPAEEDGEENAGEELADTGSDAGALGALAAAFGLAGAAALFADRRRATAHARR